MTNKKQTLSSLGAIMALMILTTTNVAQAMMSCTWVVQGSKENSSISVEEGERVSVQVTVGEQGDLVLPAGWRSESFTAGSCAGFNPATCGRWSASWVAQPGTHEFEFSVRDGACADPEKAITITVTPAARVTDTYEATWTLPEKEEVQTHVASAAPHGAADIGVGATWTPNLPTTTTNGWGFQSHISYRPHKNFLLGGVFRYSQTFIPIASGIFPEVMETQELSHFELLRLAGYLPVEVNESEGALGFELGGELGLGTLQYDTTFIREWQGRSEYVSGESQTQFVFGPHFALDLHPTKGLLLFAGFDCPFFLLKARRTAGAGEGGTGQSNPDGGKAVQAIPTFSLGVGLTL